MMLPMMRRRPAISPSPGIAVPATVRATARRNVRGGDVGLPRTRRRRRGGLIGEPPAPRTLLRLVWHQHPLCVTLEWKTRSTIRAASAQYALVRLMARLTLLVGRIWCEFPFSVRGLALPHVVSAR